MSIRLFSATSCPSSKVFYCISEFLYLTGILARNGGEILQTSKIDTIRTVQSAEVFLCKRSSTKENACYPRFLASCLLRAKKDSNVNPKARLRRPPARRRTLDRVWSIIKEALLRIHSVQSLRCGQMRTSPQERTMVLTRTKWSPTSDL